MLAQKINPQPIVSPFRVPFGFKSVNRLYTTEATIVKVGRYYKPKIALQPGMKVLVEDNKVKDCLDDEPTHEIVHCIENNHTRGLILKTLEDGSALKILL